VNQKLFECRLFCPLFALYQAKCGCADLIRKRRDLSILGTKRALNYKSRGIIPRLIFFLLVRELFYSSETFSFLSGSSALFEVSVFSKIITP
jgi:hypothetical protein